MKVPSELMIIEPFEGGTSGVVFSTKFPSTSKSPASVKSPLTEASYATVIFSLSKTGASLIGFTVMVSVAVFV